MKKASILKEEKKERRRGSDYGRKPINGNGGDRYASQEEVMTKFAATQKQERQQLAAADSTLESSVQPFPSSSPVSPLSSSLSALPTSPSSSSPLPLAQPEGSTETATPTTAEIPNTSQTVESPVVSGSISSVEIPTPEIELPKDKAFSLFDATNKRASTTFQTLNSLTGLCFFPPSPSSFFPFHFEYKRFFFLLGMGTKILRERYKSWLSTEIVGLIRTIGHGQDQQVAIEACIRLGELFKFDPEERNQLVSSSNGIVTLLKLLENSSTSEPQMLIAILSAINLVSTLFSSPPLASINAG